MLKHNFLIILRNFKRNKTTFLINLIGLSTGLACALLIFLWVNDELQIDKFHEKDARLYQVMMNSPRPDGLHTDASTPGLLADALLKEMPEVEYATAVIPSNWFDFEGILSSGNVKVKAREQYVGKDYFNIFSYRLLQGDRNSFFQDKNSILLSDEMAVRLFKTTENIVGKSVEWNRNLLNLSGSFIISGIFEKPPSNSTHQFDLILSYDFFYEKMAKDLQKWTNSNPRTYLTLKPETDVDLFNEKIKDFIKTKAEESPNTLFVQRYSDRYLYGHYENGISTGGRIFYVRLFSIIALFILAIACVNFMNLSTARSALRMKEVGVKKVIGANRKTLIIQYLSESLLLSYFCGSFIKT